MAGIGSGGRGEGRVDAKSGFPHQRQHALAEELQVRQEVVEVHLDAVAAAAFNHPKPSTTGPSRPDDVDVAADNPAGSRVAAFQDDLQSPPAKVGVEILRRDRVLMFQDPIGLCWALAYTSSLAAMTCGLIRCADVAPDLTCRRTLSLRIILLPAAPRRPGRDWRRPGWNREDQGRSALDRIDETGARRKGVDQATHLPSAGWERRRRSFIFQKRPSIERFSSLLRPQPFHHPHEFLGHDIAVVVLDHLPSSRNISNSLFL